MTPLKQRGRPATHTHTHTHTHKHIHIIQDCVADVLYIDW
jgi:hypothetical protein